MVYVKLKEDEKININENVIKRILHNFFIKIKNKFEKIKIEKIDDKILIILPNLEKRILNKFSKYIEENCICTVCLDNVLLNNENILNFLKGHDVKVLDGKWLFKHLSIKCVEYITENKKENLENQEVSILSNNINELIAFVIRELAEKVKVLNIITYNEMRFKKIEKELYDQKGIVINLSNNYKKSLQKSDVILNFDYDEETINKYSIPNDCCIVNLNNNINILSKSFNGINSHFYELTMPKKYIKYLSHLKGFNISILYESFIYKNTNPSNIVKEIEKDDAEIAFLEGINGKIRKTEFLNNKVSI